MGHCRKKQVTVYPTNKCNMRCTYCAANSAVEQRCVQKIDLDFAKQGIWDYFVGQGWHQLRFYSSGEPTQAMDIVGATTEYARGLVGDRLLVEMQTNGYFDLGVASWLADNVDIIWISLDAWPEIHDKYRPVPGDDHPSMTVLRNLEFLRKKTFVGVRATIVRETITQQEKLVEYFHSLGIDHIYTEPVFEPVKRDCRDSQGPITQVDPMKYAENFIRGWKRANELGVFYGNSFMVNFDEEVEIYCRSCLPAAHLTTDGYVSACDLGFYGDTPLQDLIYGEWDKGNKKIIYFPEKIAKLRSRKAENMERCRGCSVIKHCGGGCVGRAYHEKGSIFETIPEYCEVTRYLAKHMPIGQIKIEYLHP